MSHSSISPSTLKFQESLTLLFNNPLLLEEALTHPSVQSLNKETFNNERLEFLGDAVLKLIISDHIFKDYPLDHEGILTRIRSKLICDKFLTQLAQHIHLGQYLKLSYGEKKTGGKTKASNLANGFEALLGALYLDQGLLKTKDFLLTLIESAKLDLSNLDSSDYKSILQEYTQQKKWPLPIYTVIKEEGPDHHKHFIIESMVQSSKKTFKGLGKGSTKKDAAQAAAQALLTDFNLL